MKIFRSLMIKSGVFLVMVSILILCLGKASAAFNFPAAGWHRGDASFAQENSKAALSRALDSTNPNIELDIIDFVDANGNRIGLASHDYLMKRATGLPGAFNEKFNHYSRIPPNAANPQLPAQPFMTVVELFELIKEKKAKGIVPIVSLDMKEEGRNVEAFSRWVGEMIKAYGFQDHVFASSFFANNIDPLKAACPECLVGGLVFNDHWGLRFLSPKYSSVDITPISKATFFLGFLGKKEHPLDFILIQDDIFFKHPDLLEYWKGSRKVKFVGVFVYNKDRGYTDEEWSLLEKVEWIELDPPQMHQYLRRKGQK